MGLSRFLKRAKEIQDDVHARRLRNDDSHDSPTHDESNWLIAYADMMTLLCAFFIMMFSMSKLNAPEYEKVRKEVSEALGGDYQAPTHELAQYMTQVVQAQGIAPDTKISSDSTSVTLVFRSTLFFDSLSAYIKEDGRKALSQLIQSLKSYSQSDPKQFKIVVEGHTDSQPILSGNYASNWELSGARAAQVIRMFIDDGFLAEKMLAIGFGDTRPVAPNRSPSGEWNTEALAANRRVVIRILHPQTESIPWQENTAH